MTDSFNALTAILERLGKVIKSRRDEDPKNSYVAAKLAKGVEHCAKKVGEEAVETAMAAVTVSKGKTEHVVAESADLLFHLLILWEALGVTPQQPPMMRAPFCTKRRLYSAMYSGDDR